MKEKITLEQALNMDFPPIMNWAAPIMIGLVLLEYFLSLRNNKDLYDGKELLAATAIGLGNLAIGVVFKAAIFTIVLFAYNLVPWTIPHTWWSYVLCLIVLDCCRYWAHRIAHEQRFWWATHVTHHSSPRYNWAVSFRLSWTQHIKIIFFLPVPLMGFDPLVFFICHQIEVLYQFWIHTEKINKLPRPIEYIFTTPSHHRVHHATNDRYLDKNYGSTFIIWDRMFGTFQPEDEKATYGILKPVDSYNPFFLVFHEWIDIFKDFTSTKSWRERWKILFGSPNQVLEKEGYVKWLREKKS